MVGLGQGVSHPHRLLEVYVHFAILPSLEVDLAKASTLHKSFDFLSAQDKESATLYQLEASQKSIEEYKTMVAERDALLVYWQLRAREFAAAQKEFDALKHENARLRKQVGFLSSVMVSGHVEKPMHFAPVGGMMRPSRGGVGCRSSVPRGRRVWSGRRVPRGGVGCRFDTRGLARREGGRDS